MGIQNLKAVSRESELSCFTVMLVWTPKKYIIHLCYQEAGTK